MAIALIVEDEWLVRMEIAETLQDCGWHVIEVGSGEAGLKILREKTEIDLLITDIRLPGPVSGWDVAEAFRSSNGKIPVIYCSGNPADVARQVCESVFISKPCRMETLVETIARLCPGLFTPHRERPG